jgi:glycosyltransferase involved in cell wall biosynthesis
MHVAFITAGGAGMFCGSCMHDNTWAHALHAHGAEVSLIPTYTPIRVDEQDLSTSQVFFGGINVFMDFRSRLWRRIPRMFTRWLDWPAVIRLATRFGVSNDAHQLGALTVAMLEGELGPESREVEELAEYLAHLKPDVVCFSNALLAGVVRRLREQYQGRIYCILQGDDIFLEDLPETYREQAIEKIRERAVDFDGFLVHSEYYREFMANYLHLPRDRMHCVPLGIELAGHDGLPEATGNEHFTIGYFARICPEKGLHNLIDAFRILHAKYPAIRLRAGGYLGSRDEAYFKQTLASASDLSDAFEYIGSPETRAEKIAFLNTLDVLSVPTTYHEPKGLYVLESLANGVPVVQPRHGAFPELIEATKGGLLFEPNDAAGLAERLEALMLDPDHRLELGRRGRENVRSLYDQGRMAEVTLGIFASGLS